MDYVAVCTRSMIAARGRAGALCPSTAGIFWGARLRQKINRTETWRRTQSK